MWRFKKALHIFGIITAQHSVYPAHGIICIFISVCVHINFASRNVQPLCLRTTKNIFVVFA